MSAPTFAELGASSAVAGALAKRGITNPFPVQELILPDALAGHDVLVKSPTGSGKTLAFGVPMVERIDAGARRPAALVLAPTRELAGQIVDELYSVAAARALSITAVYGGASIGKQMKLARRSHILVATPGRLEDLLERGAVSLEHVRMLVLDEADRMLDMGFRPPVDRIVSQTPDDRQTLFFSATLDGEVRKIADAYTRNARFHEHEPAERRNADIEHRFVSVAHESKLDTLVSELRGGRNDATLVFVRTKRGADRLVKRLARHDVYAVAMHGDKSQAQREKALARFENGKVDALVATDVAARGLDVDRISHVINFDPPDDHDAYVHRIGRTGRAGRKGVGITYVGADQASDVHKIAKVLELHAEFERSGLVTSTAGPRRPSGQQRRSKGSRRRAGYPKR